MTAHRIDPDELSRRLTVANRVLELIADECYPPPWLRFKGRRAFVCWQYHGEHCKQWVTAGSDHYPSWHQRRGPWGGTTCNAMAQLIRWCQGKPVLSLAQWRYWCGPGVMLAGKNADAVIDLLAQSGWPATATCVLCGQHPARIEWWSRDGVSGPCCYGTKCRVPA